MAKKSRDQLKAEGQELGAVLADARKATLNIAAQVDADGGLIIEADRRKNADVLRKAAKKRGGGPKGVIGQISAAGKNVDLRLSEDPPGNMVKVFKKHFSERGLPIKLTVTLPSGEVLGDPDDVMEGGDVPNGQSMSDLADQEAQEGGQSVSDIADQDTQDSGQSVADIAGQDSGESVSDIADQEIDREAELARMLGEAREEAEAAKATANPKQAEAIGKLLKALQDGLPKAKPELRGLVMASFNDELNRILWGETEEGKLKGLDDAIEGGETPEPAPQKSAPPPQDAPEDPPQDSAPPAQSAALAAMAAAMTAEAQAMVDHLHVAVDPETAHEGTLLLDALTDALDGAGTEAEAQAAMQTFRKGFQKLSDLSASAGDAIAAAEALGGLIGAAHALHAKTAALPLPPEAREELDAALKTFTEELEYASPAARGGLLDDFQAVCDRLADAHPAGSAPKAEDGDLLDDLGDLAMGLGETITGALDEVGNAVQDTLAPVGEALEDLAYAVGDTLGILTEEDEGRKEELAKLGVPEDRQLEFVQIARDNPQTYASLLTALEAIENKDGEVDTSPEALETALTALDAAREASRVATEAWGAAWDANEAAKAEALKTEAEAKEAKRKLDARKAEIRAWAEALPPADEMTEAERAEVQKQREAFADELRGMQADLEAAVAAAKAARTAAHAAEHAYVAAEAEWDTANTALTDAQSDRDEIDRRNQVLDAMSFGPLSDLNDPDLTDEEVADFLDAIALDVGLGLKGVEAAAGAEDPRALGANVKRTVEAFQGGFADAGGKKLDLDEDLQRQMAEQAIATGAREGDDWFDGFNDYLATGAQHAEDPAGGTDLFPEEDITEDQRKLQVARKRTAAAAGAMLDDAGKFDATSPEAQQMLKDLQFHPGALLTPTPRVNTEVDGVVDLFETPPAGKDPQAVLDGVKAPAAGSAGAQIVGATVDSKAPDKLDAQTAVVSAMMTPLSQGPVGSCFSTGPVRRRKINDPVGTMEDMARIASEGKYKAPGLGYDVPANLTLPQGENALMRSLEYSVATAAGEINASHVKQDILAAMTTGPEAQLSAAVGSDVWDGKPGDVAGGMEDKLRAALQSELVVTYDAGSSLGGVSADGASTDGRYAFKYGGDVLDTQAKFLDAMKAIALKAAGNPDPKSELYKQVIDTIEAPAFVAPFITYYDKSRTSEQESPWKLPGGGFDTETMEALENDKFQYTDVLASDTTTPRGDRTEALLTSVLGTFGGNDEELSPMGTSTHAFNATPSHPSFQALLDGNDTPDPAKIEAQIKGPGEAVAAKEMPVRQAVALFEEEVRRQINEAMGEMGRFEDAVDKIKEALAKRPTEEMTPGELEDLIADTVKDVCSADAGQDAVANADTAGFAADFQAANGRPPTAAEQQAFLDKERADAIRRFERQIERAADQLMQDAFPTPEVVIADANWGSAEGQTYFAIAVDPSDGQLRLYTVEEPSGERTPLPNRWVNDNWDQTVQAP